MNIALGFCKRLILGVGIGQQTRMTNRIEEKQRKDSLERNEHILSILYTSSLKLDPIGWETKETFPKERAAKSLKLINKSNL